MPLIKQLLGKGYKVFLSRKGAKKRKVVNS